MYPGNHTDSEILSVPRNLKTRPDADETHLAYITDDEADLLEIYKPGTPHRGAEGIPNYDGGDLLDYVPSGMEGTGYGSQGSGASQETVQQAQQQQQQVQQNYVNMYGADKEGKPDMYKPPQEVYGPGQAIPGQTGYASINVAADKDSWNKYYSTWKSIQNMDPKTLAFFGYKPGSYNVPNELLAMVAEGSIVSGNEAVETKHLYDTGKNWASGDPVDPNVGTWSDLESGLHPMFSLEDYYDITGNPNVISTSGTGGGGGGGGGWGGYGGYGYGGGGGGGSSYGGPPKERPQFPGQPGERWGQQNPLQQMMINIHGGQGFQQGFARGGIVGLVT